MGCGYVCILFVSLVVGAVLFGAYVFVVFMHCVLLVALGGVV